MLRLPMADSIILATAYAHQARLYTIDTGFKDLHHVDLMSRS
jgi:predicted nucleic acid-binding protein